MDILRTPNAHFEGLPEWPFAPHHTTITADDGTPIRIAHAEPLVLMHGNPSWSYLHRHMMAPLAATGRRVIVVDLVARGADRRMQRHIPGATGQAHAVMPTAAHFIQEDEPQWLVERIVHFLEVRA